MLWPPWQTSINGFHQKKKKKERKKKKKESHPHDSGKLNNPVQAQFQARGPLPAFKPSVFLELLLRGCAHTVGRSSALAEVTASQEERHKARRFRGPQLLTVSGQQYGLLVMGPGALLGVFYAGSCFLSSSQHKKSGVSTVPRSP